MLRIEDECVGCPPEMGCIGSACENKNVPHLYCDECGDDADIIIRSQNFIENIME